MASKSETTTETAALSASPALDVPQHPESEDGNVNAMLHNAGVQMPGLGDPEDIEQTRLDAIKRIQQQNVEGTAQMVIRQPFLLVGTVTSRTSFRAIRPGYSQVFNLEALATQAQDEFNEDAISGVMYEVTGLLTTIITKGDPGQGTNTQIAYRITPTHMKRLDVTPEVLADYDIKVNEVNFAELPNNSRNGSGGVVYSNPPIISAEAVQNNLDSLNPKAASQMTDEKAAQLATLMQARRQGNGLPNTSTARTV